MGLVLVDDSLVNNIANTLRIQIDDPIEKKYTMSEMAQIITTLPYRATIEDIPDMWQMAIGPTSSEFYDKYGIITELKRDAFRNATILQNVILPNCKEIGDRAFAGCASLSYISLPNVSFIGPSAFYQCGGLVSIYAPSCTWISSSAFFDCRSLVSVSFPICKKFGPNAFDNCYALSEVYLPACGELNSGIFVDCKGLVRASFPVCSRVWAHAFLRCTSLSYLYFGSKVYFEQSVIFNECTALSELYLTGASVCSIRMSITSHLSLLFDNANTPQIYVPFSLYSDYLADPGWSWYSSYISAIY